MKRVSWNAVVGFAVCVGVAAIGCGGAGGSRAVLRGNPAVQATAISSAQSVNGAGTFGNEFLLDSAPNGSVTKVAAAVRGPVTKAGPGLAFNASLNLYENTATSGNKFTIQYFTDSAGQISAGHIILTQPGATAFSTTYGSFPATVTADVAVTGGNIPATGHLTIQYFDGSGSNTIAGTIHQTRNNLDVKVQMALSSTLEISGEIDMSSGGTLLKLANITGSELTGVTGDVNIAPYGWTGTGTFSLLDGTMSLNLTTPDGQAMSTLDLEQTLHITFPDQTTANLPDALTLSLTGSGSTGTTSGSNGTTSGSNGSTSGGGDLLYHAETPVPLGSATIIAVAGVSSDGRLAGKGQVSGTFQGMYWASPTSTPQVLQSVAAGDANEPAAVNASGQIVGRRSNPSLNFQPVYWSSSTATPVTMQTPANASRCEANAINDNGEVVGFAILITGPKEAVYWPTPTSAPQILTLSSSSQYQALAISNSSQIVGSDSTQPYLWTSPSAAGIPLNTSSSTMSFGGMAPDGTVVAALSVSGSAVPVKLAPGSTTATNLPTSPVAVWTPSKVNSAGFVLGTATVSGKTEAVVAGPTNAVTLLSAVPADNGWIPGFPLGIAADGTIVYQSVKVVGGQTQVAVFSATPLP